MTLTITSGATSPKPDGPSFLTEYSNHLLDLYKAAARPLTAIGGTADVVTATSAIDFTAGGIVDGTKFTLTWGAANTGAVTLNINGLGATPVIDKNGAAMVAGSIASGLRSLIEYVSGNFVILTEASVSAGSGLHYQKFTSSGTWNKPAGLDDDRMVIVEAWGGGGGGSNGAGGTGGAGGGYTRREFRAIDMPSSASVTIGAGGTVGTSGVAGGTTSVGSVLSVTGGAGGLSALGTTPQPGGGRGDLWKGGDSSGGTSSGTLDGGVATFGGGGGATVAGTAGNSIYGGNGGGNGASGAAPAGGGGRNAAGARGEVIIWIP